MTTIREENALALLTEELVEHLPGPKEMPWHIRKVKYKHRILIYLLAVGLSQKETAQELGISPEHVSRLANSPLIKSEVEAIQDGAGFKAIEYRIQGIVEDAVETAYEVMVDTSTPAATRVNAAFGFMHQVYGKPTQRVETHNLDYGDLLEVAHKIEQSRKTEEEIIDVGDGDSEG